MPTIKIDGPRLSDVFTRGNSINHAINLINNPTEEIKRDGLQVEINDADMAMNFLEKLKYIMPVSFRLCVSFKDIPEKTSYSSNPDFWPIHNGLNGYFKPAQKETYLSAINEILLEIQDTFGSMPGQNNKLLEFILPEHPAWRTNQNPVNVRQMLPEEKIDFNRSPVEMIIQITAQLLDGKYDYYSKWIDLIKKLIVSEVESAHIKETIQKNVEEAHCRLEEEKKPGSIQTANALTFLGIINSSGRLCGEPDYRKAIKFYEQAIALKHPKAINNLAYMHQYGQGVPVDYHEAIRLYNKAIALGDTDAMANRACMHHQGHGGPINYREAIRQFDLAITLGNAVAMNGRALLYKDGQGTEVNYSEAIRLFDLAVALGNTNAMNNRAAMHYNGQGCPLNYSMAIRLFEQAIVLGDSDAMNNRATMHYMGQGDSRNYPEAIRLLKQAIALGNRSAMTGLALMYHYGAGFPVDYARAIYFYEKAIFLGDKEGLDRRGIMHRQHLGESKAEASQLLELIWEDLLAGHSFTTATIILLRTHCKGAILEKLISPENTLTEQQILKLGEINHPIAQIFGVQNIPIQNFFTTHNIVIISAFIRDYLSERVQSFTCPITQVLISEPLTYNVNGVQQIFERIAFQSWQNLNNTCPKTRASLQGITITQCNVGVQKQITYLKPYVKDDGSSLTLNEIESQLKSEEKSILFWIKNEILSAINLNDDSKIVLFVKHLPICIVLFSNFVMNLENIEKEQKSENGNTQAPHSPITENRAQSGRVASLLLSGILSQPEEKQIDSREIQFQVDQFKETQEANSSYRYR